MKNTKLNIYLPIILSVVMVVGILIGFKLAPISNFKHDQVLNFTRGNYNKISDVINYIEQDYVDSISRTDLNDNAIEAYLKNWILIHNIFHRHNWWR